MCKEPLYLFCFWLTLKEGHFDLCIKTLVRIFRFASLSFFSLHYPQMALPEGDFSDLKVESWRFKMNSSTFWENVLYSWSQDILTSYFSPYQSVNS